MLLTEHGQQIGIDDLYHYMDVKSKKMNHKMMVLADCIGLEEPISNELLEYISMMGKVYEIRAIAYKSLVSNQLYDNLYNYWHLYRKGCED